MPSDKYVIRHEEKDYALFVNDVTDADVGVYECRAKNPEGECNATAEITIASTYQNLRHSDNGAILVSDRSQ